MLGGCFTEALALEREPVALCTSRSRIASATHDLVHIMTALELNNLANNAHNIWFIG